MNRIFIKTFTFIYVGIVCYLIYLSPNILDLKYIKLFNMVVIVAAGLSSVFPKHFSMGIDGFNESGWFMKVFPIPPILAIIYGIEMLPRTYDVIGFASAMFGILISYISFISAIGTVILIKQVRRRVAK